MKSFFKPIIVAILTIEAKAVLLRHRPKIVAVTGSVGKTSAKDAIYSVLASGHYARKSEKSFNSDIGVPLTILGLQNAWSNPVIWLVNLVKGFFVIFSKKFPEWLVLEVGADRPGDIRKIARWLKPDAVVLTRFSETPVHIEFFKTRDDLIEEKFSLAKALRADGTLLINSDDADILRLSKDFRTKVLSFGLTGESDVRVASWQIDYEDNSGMKLPSGMKATIEFGEENFEIKIPCGAGIQQLYPYLIATTFAISQKIPSTEIRTALMAHIGPAGRMRFIGGIKNSLIVDDTYNSSPVALEKALETLKSFDVKGTKIAVLGDMLELGKFSAEEHRRLGVFSADCADFLITVGLRARGFAEGALEAGMSDVKILQYEDTKTAGKELERLIKPGDIILIKGSQGSRMEKIVEEIMAEPERKAELLVRQEKEWKGRR